jgi:hypothetical protein
MTVEEVRAEVDLLTLDNVRTYPMSRSQKNDFYEVWTRHGPEAARLYILPAIWEGKIPLPSETLLKFDVQIKVK